MQQEATENFGTSDVDELASKLAAMEKENEKRRSDYQKLLEGIAKDLAKIEAESVSENSEASDAE